MEKKYTTSKQEIQISDIFAQIYFNKMITTCQTQATQDNGKLSINDGSKMMGTNKQKHLRTLTRLPSYK